MPEITVLGWFHTAIGIVALLSGAYTLAVGLAFQLRWIHGQRAPGAEPAS